MTLDQLPHIVENALATVTLRCWQNHFGTGGQGRAKRYNRRKHVEHWQRAHLHVFFREQQLCTQPSVVNNARKPVLRDLWHPSRPARMEISGDTVFSAICEL